MSDSYIAKCLYFNRPGPKNTEALVKHAANRAGELGIKKIVLASGTGRTAYAALEAFGLEKHELIMVSQVTGFSQPDLQKLNPDTRADLEAKGMKILTAAHAFGGVGRAVRNKLSTYQIDEIMAFTLRMFGQGLKVCIEISYMAADRGWVRTDEDIIAIAGTGGGADTAAVIRPQPSHTGLELKVKEIIAKPFNP